MPYKRKGKVVYIKENGEWVVKQRCRSAVAAQKALNLLRAVKHGWVPTGGK